MRTRSYPGLQELEPTVKSFDALAELATEYGMDPSELTETVDKYNRGVDTEDDEFGKPFHSDLTHIVKPPSTPLAFGQRCTTLWAASI